MKHKNLILSCVMVFCLVVGVFSAEAAVYNLKMEATTDAGVVTTSYPAGSTLLLNIDLDTDQVGVVAGCAFTLTYPTDKLDGPATTADGLATPETDIQSSLLMMTINDAPEKTHRVNAPTGTGQILFSGAAIDTEGGSGFHYQDATLFTVKFTVKAGATGDITFGLQQTQLLNADAGWGIDTDSDGVKDTAEGAPILVGAVGKDHPDFGGDLSDDFPELLGNFAENPALTVSVQADAFSEWLSANYPEIAASEFNSAEDDYDHDGISNGDEWNEGTGSTDPSDPTVPVSDADVADVDVTDPNTWPANPDYDAVTDFRVSNMDIDGNGTAGATTDAVLLYRKLADDGSPFPLYTDEQFLDGAVDADCTRCDITSIKTYIDTIKKEVYDVDGSGEPALTTDATLIYRYALDAASPFPLYTDEQFIEGAVDTVNCTRCSAADIKAYISEIFPD